VAQRAGIKVIRARADERAAKLAPTRLVPPPGQKTSSHRVPAIGAARRGADGGVIISSAALEAPAVFSGLDDIAA
jgi:hypothetical protein